MDRTEEFIIKMKNRIFNVIRKKKRLYFAVKNDDIKEVAQYLSNNMKCRLSTATATELYNGIEVLYHFSLDETGEYFCPRVLINDKKKPKMFSITPIVKGAEWIEREMYDLFGIDFVGHPRKELLLTGNHPEGLRQPLRITKVT
jgi:NADH-quinone oxidoreductase subunit C